MEIEHKTVTYDAATKTNKEYIYYSWEAVADQRYTYQVTVYGGTTVITPQPGSTATPAPTATPSPAQQGFTIKNGVLTAYTGTSKDPVIPDGVVEIGDGAFQRKSIYSVTIPEGVKKIGNNAFELAEELTTVILPSSLKEIGDYAFNRTKLSYIYLPDGVTSIGNYAFRSTYLTELVIPGSVETIGQYAFEDCTVLEQVYIREGVKTVQSYAFKDCVRLTSISFADSISAIESYALQGCYRLTSVKLPKNCKKLGAYVFLTCVFVTSGDALASELANLGYTVRRTYEAPSPGVVSGMAALKIPSSTTEIGVEAFMGASFQRVVLPDGLKTISPRAFQDCANLLYINIPDSVEYIAWDAFRNCKGVYFECSSGSVGESFAQSHGYTAVIN